MTPHNLTQNMEPFDPTQEVAPFDFDQEALDTVIGLIDREGTREFVETGTYLGGTSLGVKTIRPSLTVWTVEQDARLYMEACYRLRRSGVLNLYGDSISVLRDQIIPNIKHPRPMFFLDSHVSSWNVIHNPALVEHYPLRDEIDLIAAALFSLRPIVVIHDFFNPEHPELGYDVDHGHPLNWKYIKDHADRLAEGEVEKFYNQNPTGHRIGIIYLNVRPLR